MHYHEKVSKSGMENPWTDSIDKKYDWRSRAVILQVGFPNGGREWGQCMLPACMRSFLQYNVLIINSTTPSILSLEILISDTNFLDILLIDSTLNRSLWYLWDREGLSKISIRGIRSFSRAFGAKYTRNLIFAGSSISRKWSADAVPMT